MKMECYIGIRPANIITYADDFVLLSPSAKYLQLLINKVNELLVFDGLTINNSITVCMKFNVSNNLNSDMSFKLHNKPLNNVKEEKYLVYLIA